MRTSATPLGGGRMQRPRPGLSHAAVKLIVPSPPAAKPTDILARTIGRSWRKRKQPVIVANKPGAGATSAPISVAKAKHRRL
jgi:tripartite-type tricarboxylate transporter receptor subunit TctC